MKIEKIEENCTNCMLCVKDCVAAVWREDKGIVKVISSQDCTLCSHCLAVCPKDAILHDGLDSTQINKIDRALIDPMVYKTIAMARRSIRQYKNKSVSKELINEVIHLANYSPTASNSQHVKYIVISKKETLNLISKEIFGFASKVFRFTKQFPGNIMYNFIKNYNWSETLTRYIDPLQYYIDETEKGRDFILHNAPALILIHGPKRGSFSSINCSIAATNIINYAYSQGLGTCYIGFLNLSLKYSKKLRSVIQVPKDRVVYACLIIGYPSYRYTNTVSRSKPDISWI